MEQVSEADQVFPELARISNQLSCISNRLGYSNHHKSALTLSVLLITFHHARNHVKKTMQGLKEHLAPQERNTHPQHFKLTS